MRGLFSVVSLLAALVLGCANAPEPPTRYLEPEANPMGSDDALWSALPHRERPRRICVSHDGHRGWVLLGGTVDAPADSVVVVDLDSGALLDRIVVGRSPWACDIDPTGRYLVVTLRYADRAVVLDTESHEEVGRVPVPFYTESVLFGPNGDRVYLANRWKDSILVWDVSTHGDFNVRATNYDGLEDWEPMGIPVADNPEDLALSSDGRRLFVGAVAGCVLDVVDTTTLTLERRIDLHSPVGALAVYQRWLFVADIGPGLGSPPAEGRDANNSGHPGDDTANVVFQDLQNEIAVFDTETLTQVHRYTSDSICCQDYRDVDPDAPDRGLLIPAPDTWGPEVVPWLAPRSTWIVAGALPEAFTIADGVLWTAFAGSNELQGFRILEDGALHPIQTAPNLIQTGYNPVDVATTATGLVTVDRLAESLSLVDASGAVRRVVFGDESDGPFPATDVELGEAINEMTAPLTVDGDQTCVHCHRDNNAISRPVVMPLQADRLWGVRNMMAQRGLYDTRPWFAESSMGETNFFPVLNEFFRKENFCCERTDPTVWFGYPSVDDCVKDGTKDGCEYVLHCEDNPPPECAARPYAVGLPGRRSEYIRAQAKAMLGRDMSFGDALYREDFDGVRSPIPLDFDGVTRAIGLFMMRTPRLLPNPNLALHLPTARRGSVLFNDPAVGCALCHPLPATTTASLPKPFSPSGMPVRFPPVISQTKSPDGTNASLVNPGFMATFPETVQGPAGLNVGATPLRGLWDRPQTHFYHDGRARSLLEALVPPGHAALNDQQTGHNERDGVLDTHGGTSQLDRYQLEDLMNFLRTL